MHLNDLATIFRQFTRVAVFGFLMWTLSSSVFLDASTAFLEKKLKDVKTLSDQTADHFASVTQLLLRW